MRSFLIVLLSMLGVFLFIILWIWHVVFKGSLRKMVFTMLGIIQNRDMIVDPDAEIIPNREKYSSDVLEEKAAHLKGQAGFEPQKTPQKARVATKPNETTESTSDDGWPRQLDYETRHEKHPFLDVHLRTETEQTHEIMDVDTYNPSETDSQSD